MIKIDVGKINNWNKIKINHCEYFRNIVQKELSNLYIMGSTYSKKRNETKKSLEKVYYQLNNVERSEIESDFGGVFSIKNGKSIFTINNDEKIQCITSGDLEDVIYIFNKSSINKTLVDRIFNYKKFCNNKGWNRHKLLSMLEIKVCPYCNRQYITSYEGRENNEKKTTADLDHFYSQSEYPYLALSLYNFIPSCQICNSRFKLNENFRSVPHIYPYKEEFKDNAKFKIRGTSIEYLLGNSSDFDIYIDIKDSELKEKIKNSIITFHLNEVYKTHTDYVQEIIKKAIIYNDSRINEIMFDFPKLFSSKDEVFRMIFGNYINNADLGKRPLSKLTKDICEELGLNFK
ncbi:hypothetical protein [Clostridium estertheticum]|uniref:HNH endonuclease n=1 Tax=Clostridium estertheticum TaxID=238834 RepID=A0A7Y3WUI3_9CLOT|nr:hypothetical protein [Clostridium estertheticum]NNU78149.1 hypothetical protein [Clostridium estertheticum]WBL47738.1 hypothetical protein LOR37_03345 [Clostridium estertheticum]